MEGFPKSGHLCVIRLSNEPTEEATKESPFFLMQGRDLRLPTEAALHYPMEREHVDLGEHGTELAENLTEAWESAKLYQAGPK